MDFVSIDFETANRDPASICALGIVVVTNDIISERKQWLIRPRNCIFDPWNTKIHGICEADVGNEPIFEQLWPTINEYIENRVIVAHNASFDVNVLRHALTEGGFQYPSFKAVCSLMVAREAWPKLQNHQLSTISEFLAINHKHHDALSDAEAAAHIILTAKDLFGFRTICEFSNGYGVDTSNIKLNIDHDFWDEIGFDIHFSEDQIKRQQSSTKVKVNFMDQLEKTGLINNYKVSLAGCECRDYIIRRLPCKHMYRLAIDLGIFDLKQVKENGNALPKKSHRANNVYKVHGDPCIQISINTEDIIRQIVNELRTEKDAGNISEEEYERKMDNFRQLLS